MAQETLVLTIMSEDRAGIINELSTVLADANGSWVESSMMSLDGKFAGILSASLPIENTDSFRVALKALDADGISVRAESGTQQDEQATSTTITLELTGQDRPGLLAQLTGLLSNNRINIVKLSTRCESASMSGETLFIANCKAHLPATLNADELQEHIENLADDLVVDIMLET